MTKRHTTSDIVAQRETYFRTTMRQARVDQGVSQQELANRLAEVGIILDSSAITRLEKGQRVIRLGEAVEIGALLGFSIQPDIETEALGQASWTARAMRRIAEDITEMADRIDPTPATQPERTN